MGWGGSSAFTAEQNVCNKNCVAAPPVPWKYPLDHPGDDTRKKTQGRKLQNTQEGFRGALERQDVRTGKNYSIWIWPAWPRSCSLTVNDPTINPWQTRRQCSFCARQMLILQKWSQAGIPAAFHKMVHRHLCQVCEHTRLFAGETTLKNGRSSQRSFKKKVCHLIFILYFQKNSLYKVVESFWLQDNLKLMGRWQQQKVWPSGESPQIPAGITEL